MTIELTQFLTIFLAQEDQYGITFPNFMPIFRDQKGHLPLWIEFQIFWFPSLAVIEVDSYALMWYFPDIK